MLLLLVPLLLVPPLLLLRADGDALGVWAAVRWAGDRGGGDEAVDDDGDRDDAGCAALALSVAAGSGFGGM